MSFLNSFFSLFSQSGFIKAFLESLCIGDRALWPFNLYSLNNKLFLKFSDSNTVAKLKDVEHKACKVLMEDLPQVLVLTVLINYVVACKHAGDVAVNNSFYVVLCIC